MEMEFIKKKLRNYDGIVVDSGGRSEGVAMLWCKDLDVKLLFMSLNHIDVMIKGPGVTEEWRFTGIYDWLENQNKTRTWDLIRDLRGHYDLPWLVRSDLNEIWFNFEKKDKWLPCPFSFKSILPDAPVHTTFKVADLIDVNLGCWKADLIQCMFNPCDVNTILNISLCPSWPDDIFIWRFSPNGSFAIRSTYHLTGLIKKIHEPAASSNPNPWKKELEPRYASKHQTVWLEVKCCGSSHML
ncbi:hypothetical protein Cgig2_000639 [Carnegiea gigantea]|uniref:Uncharacterized protein n=1 Tax=Carnegiea gigantea TaxID=171969 RepID=A0A9Q1GRX9_9CARY|nr:hypothetical protein Cgig2_000639 [Carnegiea gigantea]